MAVIYMESTLNLFAKVNLEKTEKLIKLGEIKQTEIKSGAQGTKYLKIIDNQLQ